MSSGKNAPPPKTPASERVDRAEKRRVDRDRQPPPMGRTNTPFGPGTLTDRGRGQGGHATTNIKDFPGATKASTTDMSYPELLGKATPETMKEVERESRKRSRSDSSWTPVTNANVTDPDQRRIASGLFMVSLSEEQRHRVAPKGFRSGLRSATKKAESGGDGEERAEAMFEAFPQAAPAKYRRLNDLDYSTGAKALLPPVSSRVEDLRRDKARQRTGGHLSDSSDED
jgi:hypothetical protein